MLIRFEVENKISQPISLSTRFEKCSHIREWNKFNQKGQWMNRNRRWDFSEVNHGSARWGEKVNHFTTHKCLWYSEIDCCVTLSLGRSIIKYRIPLVSTIPSKSFFIVSWNSSPYFFSFSLAICDHLPLFVETNKQQKVSMFTSLDVLFNFFFSFQGLQLLHLASHQRNYDFYFHSEDPFCGWGLFHPHANHSRGWNSLFQLLCLEIYSRLLHLSAWWLRFKNNLSLNLFV